MVYMWNLRKKKIQISLSTKVENRLTLTKGEGGGDKMGDQDGRVHTTVYKRQLVRTCCGAQRTVFSAL